ncbi:MAG TPA: trypsin-like serine protease [Kofleriaceae bacterium]|nr:trypsin-like serine protease [Kofleriaceae bacterium]
MRAVTVAASLVLIPALAQAENDGTTQVVPTTDHAEVVGGTAAPSGKWPDAAAILFGGQQGCTGTLIAPNVVLTAGHCDDSTISVLIGTSSLARPGDGETLRMVSHRVTQGADMTVIVLEQASKFTPRAIASGWASLDIKNGAAVEIVGFGAIDPNASQFVDELQEVASTITDFDCSVKAGCEQNELGAGGNGIDSCNGDSGGPLYLLTDYGNFLVGVTSRAYADATNPCGEGGIYGRPDKLLAEIEQLAGVPVTHGPEPTAEKLIALRGGGAETTIVDNDPKSTTHTFTLKTSPTMGVAKVREDGRVRVCMNPDATPGDNDSVLVTVADTNDAARTLDVKIPISIATNAASDECDVNAFESGDDDGGCCSSGRSAAGSLPLSALVLGLVLRRRRR